jgi:hypothetical protein
MPLGSVVCTKAGGGNFSVKVECDGWRLLCRRVTVEMTADGNSIRLMMAKIGEICGMR